MQWRCPSVVGQPKEEGAVKPPRAVVLISDVRQDGGRIKPEAAAAQAKKLGIPIYTVSSGRRKASSRRSSQAGPQDHPGSGQPETLQQVAKAREASSSPLRTLRAEAGVRGARLTARHEEAGPRDHRLFAALAAGLLLIGASTSAFVLRGVS
jgi:hypothetical protein